MPGALTGRRMIGRGVVCSFMVLAFAGYASAQPRERLNLFAADARLTFPGYKQSDSVAAALGVDKLALPSRGFGVVFGAHLYPLRKGVVTLGLGAEVMASKRGKTPDAPTAGGTQGPTVETRFSAFSPQNLTELRSEAGLELPQWRRGRGASHHGAGLEAAARRRRPDQSDQLRRRRTLVLERSHCGFAGSPLLRRSIRRRPSEDVRRSRG